MKSRFAAAAVVGLTVLALISPTTAQGRTAQGPATAQSRTVERTATPPTARPACAAAHGRHAGCFAKIRPIRSGTRMAAAAPTGLSPAQIVAAYRAPTSKGAGQTVAIVDAYDNPRAEADLAVFRKHFKLPACTTANKCFRKVNQRGASKPLPAGDPGWGIEIALDLQAVSSTCPRCHILLVEANSDDIDALGTAVNTAVRLHATVVSNSYGIGEYNGINAVAKKYYSHAGIPMVAATGDDGFLPAVFPAAVPTTIAVGGTSLIRAAGTARGWHETVWGNDDGAAGSGCSAYFAKPSYQHDSNCPARTFADVAAVADPQTGLSVYDTYGLGSDNGWNVIGGTSLAAPLVAGMMALAGRRLSSPSFLYSHRGAFYDVVGGSNAIQMDCGGDYLCTGLGGYDGPTGIGTPHGIAGL
jgi:subtilase family serine protease